MEAVLLRTASVPALESLTSSRITSSLSSHDLHFMGSDSHFNNLRLSLSTDRSKCKTIRRAMSESDMMSGVVWIGGGGFRSAKIVEEEWLNDDVDSNEEVGDYSGGRGNGKVFGRGSGGGGFGGDDGRSEVEFDLYYKQMLKLNPMDPLLLRNYAKFLHEVMKDTVRADEYYGRAILANPADGEVLGLYGKFIWETQKDSERAKSYFDQAVHASPENCVVMGMYAEFMWETEDEEEDEDEDKDCLKMNEASFISSATSLATITAY